MDNNALINKNMNQSWTKVALLISEIFRGNSSFLFSLGWHATQLYGSLHRLKTKTHESKLFPLNRNLFRSCPGVRTWCLKITPDKCLQIFTNCLFFSSFPLVWICEYIHRYAAQSGLVLGNHKYIFWRLQDLYLEPRHTGILPSYYLLCFQNQKYCFDIWHLSSYN